MIKNGQKSPLKRPQKTIKNHQKVWFCHLNPFKNLKIRLLGLCSTEKLSKSTFQAFYECLWPEASEKWQIEHA
jgi:hypothetical protein